MVKIEIILAIVLGVLLVFSIVQTIELGSIKAKLSGFSIKTSLTQSTQSSISSPSTTSSARSTGMVGGC
ncbi:MAG: hypothetical protein QW244_03285 [Candidatus Pacearchaeota archaeon]